MIFCVLALLSGVNADAHDDSTGIAAIADSAAMETPRSIVRCERITVDNMQVDDTIDITVESFGHVIAGFDIKIGIDSRYVTIKDILQGTLCDSCEWEYFSANNFEGRPGNAERPPTVWQAVGISKVMPDSTQPACLSLEGKHSLMRVILTSEMVAEIPDTTVPIFFYWEDCTDNSFSNQGGGSLLLSDRVFEYFGETRSGQADLFPTRLGAPRQCVNPRAHNKPKRELEFHNGGVEFKLDTGEKSEDSTEQK